MRLDGLSLSGLAGLSLSEKLELLTLLEARERLSSRRKFYELFPDEGPRRRELYPKHIQFFAAGLEHSERLFMAANRVGKTVNGAYETTCHLTGLYPEWWPGRRFEHPVEWWAAGTTKETTRDIIQKELFGAIGKLGTGMVPYDLIVGEPKVRANSGGAYDYVTVKHVSGGVSVIGLKSYEQGRKAFEGTSKHGIWLDEEPPKDIYSECLLRTTIVDDGSGDNEEGGIIYITFTPLEGATEVVQSFIEKAVLRV